MKLVLQRRGSFRCHWASTGSVCGVNVEPTPTYEYLCKIETGVVLDKNGFIIDQLDIDKYFKTKYSEGMDLGQRIKLFPPKSCELIALDAVTDIKRLVETHMMKTTGASHLFKIAVTVRFGQDAQMTAEWTPEKSKLKKRKQLRRTEIVDWGRLPAHMRSIDYNSDWRSDRP